VILGILAASVAFLVAFPLLVSGVFEDPTQVLALLSALFGTIVGLVGTYFGIKTSSDAQRRAAEERVTKAEERVEAAPEQATPAWGLARATLDQSFQRNLGQIRLIFLLSVVVMLVGFLVICFGVLRAFQSPDVLLPATIATLAGVITEFIGATFLFIYRSAIKQAVDYSKSLERINSVGMAMQILDTMPTPPDPAAPDSLKSKTKATLAERLVQQAYEGSRGDQ
jgi:Ca2+/H+ antiporter